MKTDCGPDTTYKGITVKPSYAGTSLLQAVTHWVAV